MTEDSKVEEVKVENTEVPPIVAGDLVMMVKIIDAGSERGAWKGEELGTIGTLRTKLVQIVQSVAPVQDDAANVAEVAEAAPADEVVDDEAPKVKRKRSAKTA